MKSNQVRSFVVIGVLVIGLLVIYAPRYFASSDQSTAASTDRPHYTYIADLDFWQRTPRETQVSALARFDLDADLNDVPLQLGNWAGEDVPETNEEVMILLEPEQYIRRLYQDDQGRYIWLSMIGGRNSRPFHAPDICYDADGWQYDLGSRPVELRDGGEVYGLWLEAEKLFPDRDVPTEHVVYYFYLFPDAQRDLADGIVLFKLTSERYGSIDDTLAMQADFVRELFTQAN